MCQHAGDPAELRDTGHVPAMRRHGLPVGPMQDPAGEAAPPRPPCPAQPLGSSLEPLSVPSSPLPLALQVFDDFIFVFFAMEMVLKMVALGIFGKKCYLGDTWNRLDFFIVMAG